MELKTAVAKLAEVQSKRGSKEETKEKKRYGWKAEVLDGAVQSIVICRLGGETNQTPLISHEGHRKSFGLWRSVVCLSTCSVNPAREVVQTLPCTCETSQLNTNF